MTVLPTNVAIKRMAADDDPPMNIDGVEDWPLSEPNHFAGRFFAVYREFTGNFSVLTRAGAAESGIFRAMAGD